MAFDVMDIDDLARLLADLEIDHTFTATTDLTIIINDSALPIAFAADCEHFSAWHRLDHTDDLISF